MTVQPTVFRLFGTPKATSKETEEEKTSSVVWYSSSRVGGRNKESWHSRTHMILSPIPSVERFP